MSPWHWRRCHKGRGLSKGESIQNTSKKIQGEKDILNEKNLMEGGVPGSKENIKRKNGSG